MVDCLITKMMVIPLNAMRLMPSFCNRSVRKTKCSSGAIVYMMRSFFVFGTGEAALVKEPDLTADDGSKLYINDEVVVDQDGSRGMREKEGSIHLEGGRHKIEVHWYNSGGGLGLYTFFNGPCIPKQVLSSDQLLTSQK